MTHHAESSYSPEKALDNSESFISDERMKGMILSLLRRTGRIDDDGIIQPITVERRLYDPTKTKWLIGPSIDDTYRDDILIPTAEQKSYITTDQDGQQIENRVLWLKRTLYNTLTERKHISLSDIAMHELRIDEAALTESAAESGNYKISHSDRQLEDAYHIHASDPQPAEFAATRVYVPGGLSVMAITSYAIKAGAEFEYAKVWTPQLTKATQEFRNDAPIFEVKTFAQLASTVSALRNVSKAGLLNLSNEAPLVGEPIRGLPGVYIGQTKPGSSFNGTMDNLFSEPIDQACSALPLPEDHKITDEWLREAARVAKQIAHNNAADEGIDPNHHAFLVDQPAQRIIDVANAA